MSWNTHDIADLSGKTAIVTGGNIGLGFQTSQALAAKGARVIIACRSRDKGEMAISRIRNKHPDAQLETIQLDLTSSESIRCFVELFSASHQTLDILVNNAGVVNLEQLQRTSDGHEMHMATNHFGHFALTGRLMPALLNSAAARVVTVSSGAYKAGEIRFDDLDWQQRPYSRMKAYGDSKLANLLFTLELENYFRRLKCNARSLCSHPGLTATERQQSIGIGGILAHWLAAPVEKGVLPQLFAATATDAQANLLYGPKYGIFGPVTGNSKVFNALDKKLAQQLWQVSEEITGVSYPHQELK